MPRPTDRQVAAFPRNVAEAQRYVDTSTVPPDILHWNWDIAYSEEVRPGRGHDLRATYCDGEYLVQIRMDVYGNGSTSVAEVTWLHSSSLEECDCEYCEKERDEDD